MISDLASSAAYIGVPIALVAAIVAAIAAIIGHAMSRANARLAAEISKTNAILTAELEVAKTLAASRQAWIDSLRSEFSKFCSLLALYNDPSSRAELAACKAKIDLLLNPNESGFNEIQEAIQRCFSAASIAQTDNSEALEREVSSFIRASQHILKTEWVVLRDDLKRIPSQFEQ